MERVVPISLSLRGAVAIHNPDHCIFTDSPDAWFLYKLIYVWQWDVHVYRSRYEHNMKHSHATAILILLISRQAVSSDYASEQSVHAVEVLLTLADNAMLIRRHVSADVTTCFNRERCECASEYSNLCRPISSFACTPRGLGNLKSRSRQLCCNQLYM